MGIEKFKEIFRGLNVAYGKFIPSDTNDAGKLQGDNKILRLLKFQEPRHQLLRRLRVLILVTLLSSKVCLRDREVESWQHR